MGRRCAMAALTVNGVVLWTRNIHGDAHLREGLSQLPGGEEIELVVNGVRGHWRKMADGKDGRSTPGLAPRGRMQAVWRELNKMHQGEEVLLERPETPNEALLIYPALATTESERMEALGRLLSIKGAVLPEGWRFDRQEIYDERDHELEARRLRNA